MSTAKRRLNSTGRKRITRNHVDVRMLATPPGEPPRATMSLKLDDLALPESAAVVVEAYHRSSGTRIDCGTVGAQRVPDVLRLDELDRGGAVLFRVKVVDRDGQDGKILAVAERLRPRSDEADTGRRSLFPIIHTDLGARVWDVEIDDAGPALLLNNRIAGFTERILQNPLLQGIVLPAAFRQVLTKLAADPSEDEDDEATWKTDWLRYCSDELGVIDDPSDLDPDAVSEWIEDAVRRFCQRYDFVDRIKTMIALEHEHG